MIQGQATKLGRSIHNIRYDPVHDEIIAATPVAQAILVFRGGADGEEAPLRIIQGPKTQLWDPDFVGVSGRNNEIYVTSGERVLVFNQQANGDVAPIRIIEGPDTMLGRMRGAPQVAEDPDLMVVASGPIPGQPEKGNGSMLIFKRTDNGNVKPQRVITSASVSGEFVVSPKGWILISGGGGGDGGVRIFSALDNGNAPPRWIFGGPRSNLTGGGDLGLNPAAKELIVLRGQNHSHILAGYPLPEIFDIDAN
jgi:hypothetical protein